MKAGQVIVNDLKSLKKETLTDKAVKSLANSIYQTLKDEGCETRDIIGVSSQLLGLVSSALESAATDAVDPSTLK